LHTLPSSHQIAEQPQSENSTYNDRFDQSSPPTRIPTEVNKRLKLPVTKAPVEPNLSPATAPAGKMSSPKGFVDCPPQWIAHRRFFATQDQSPMRNLRMISGYTLLFSLLTMGCVTSVANRPTASASRHTLSSDPAKAVASKPQKESTLIVASSVTESWTKDGTSTPTSETVERFPNFASGRPTTFRSGEEKPRNLFD
jgi:hypothetical protein